MASYIRLSDNSYVEASWSPENAVSCAIRPSLDHVLADTWQTDPMDPVTCWRVKTLAEIEAEKNAMSDFEQQFDPVLKAFALVVLDEINLLRVNAGLTERTKEQLKQAINSKL